MRLVGRHGENSRYRVGEEASRESELEHEGSLLLFHTAPAEFAGLRRSTVFPCCQDARFTLCDKGHRSVRLPRTGSTLGRSGKKEVSTFLCRFDSYSGLGSWLEKPVSFLAIGRVICFSAQV
jgi:hypothetical protein